MELYLLSGLDFRIIDGDENPVTLEKAKELVESGQVEAMNIAMSRLINMDFDLDALKEYYAEQEAVI